MGRYAELMANMRVAVLSPDNQIRGTLAGPESGDIEFLDDSYDSYTERRLESQLAALAKLMLVGRQRAHCQAMTAASGFEYEPAPKVIADPTRREYDKRWREQTSEGMSRGRRVYASATGMRTWKFIIKDGTLAELDEAGFLAELRDAIEELLRDQDRLTRTLRNELYRGR